MEVHYEANNPLEEETLSSSAGAGTAGPEHILEVLLEGTNGEAYNVADEKGQGRGKELSELINTSYFYRLHDVYHYMDGSTLVIEGDDLRYAINDNLRRFCRTDLIER